MTPPGARRTGRRPTVLVQADGRDVRIYQGLIERGYRLTGFPASHAASVAARKLPIEPVDFADAIDPRAAVRAEQIAMAMWPNLETVLQQPGFAEFARLAHPLLPEAIREQLSKYIRGLLASAAAVVEAFELLVQREDIRLLMVRDEALPAHPLILAARRHGIRSLHLMHGIPYSRVLAAHIHSDVVAAYGEWTRDWYAKFGDVAHRVAVTGNPAWDGYRDTAMLHDPRDVRRSMGFDPDVPVVMYAASVMSRSHAADYLYPNWAWQHYEAAIRALAEVNRRRPIQLVVKLHPADYRSDVPIRHGLLATDAGLRTLVVGGWADPRHILASDVLICLDSNMAVEAMLVDRPVISLRLGDLFVDYLYGPEDGVLIVDDADSLTGAIEAALFDPATQAALAARRVHSLYRFNYLNDGRAFDRTLNLIDWLLDPADAERRLERGAPAPLLAKLTPAQRQSIARQHLDAAQRQLEGGVFEGAAYLADRSIAFADNTAGAHFLRGCAALRRKRPQVALRDFLNAIAAEPRSPTFYNALAAAWHDMGRTDAAEEALRQALAIEPADLDTLLNLVEILLEQGRLSAAGEFLERARGIAPDDEQIQTLVVRLGARS